MNKKFFNIVRCLLHCHDTNYSAQTSGRDLGSYVSSGSVTFSRKTTKRPEQSSLCFSLFHLHVMTTAMRISAVVCVLVSLLLTWTQAEPTSSPGTGEEWKLVATEIDSETISYVSQQGQELGMLWSQPYARVRELTSYHSDKPFILFNGGGSTSIYRHDIKSGNLSNLIDGSSNADKSFGRMAAFPDQDLLVIVDVLRFQLLMYSLSSGTLLGSSQPFSGQEGCNTAGDLTFIAPASGTGISLYAWNLGAGCLLKLSSPTRKALGDGVMKFTTKVRLNASVQGLADVTEDPAGNLHLLYSSCSISVLWTTRPSEPQSKLSFKSDLDQKAPALNGTSQFCHQMVFHVGSKSYLVTAPASRSLAVLGAVDGALKGVINTQSLEPYSVSTSAWNEDLLLLGTGSSVYGTGVSKILSVFNTNKKRMSYPYIWNDLLPPGDIPVPDLSRVVQQPDVLGAGLYTYSGSKGYLLRPIKSGVYHVVSVDNYSDYFYALDSISYFPSPKCHARVIGATPEQVKTYFSGISSSKDSNTLYELDGSKRKELLSTPSRERILSIDHHPSRPLLAAGIADGSIVLIDTNRDVLIKKFSLGPKSKVTSVSWDCDSDSIIYATDASTGRFISYSITFVQGNQEPVLTKQFEVSGVSNPKAIVQDPKSALVYVLEQGNSVTVKLVNTTTANQSLSVSPVFARRFSTLLFQKASQVTKYTGQVPSRSADNTTSLASSLFKPSSLPPFDPNQIGSPAPVSTSSTSSSSSITTTTASPEQETPEEETNKGTTTERIESDVLASPSTSGSVQQQQTPGQEKMGVSKEDSVEKPMAIVVVMIAIVLVLALGFLLLNKYKDRQHIRRWSSGGGPPSNASFTTKMEYLRAAFAKTFRYQENPRAELNASPAQDLESTFVNGDKDLMAEAEKYPKSAEDEELEHKRKAMARMDSSKEDATLGLRRFLKIAGVGARETAKNMVDMAKAPFSSPSTYVSAIEPAPRVSRDAPIQLKVFEVHGTSAGGRPILKPRSGTSSSGIRTPVEEQQQQIPVVLPASRIPTEREAAVNYHASTSSPTSVWRGGSTVSVSERTGEIHEEIDLNSTTRSDDESSRSRRSTASSSSRSSEKVAGLGDKIRSGFKDILTKISVFSSPATPFRPNSTNSRHL